MTVLLTIMLALTAFADLEDAGSIRARARTAVGVERVESSLDLPADAAPAEAPARRETATPIETGALPTFGGPQFQVIGVVLGFVLLGVVVAVMAFAVARMFAEMSWGDRRIDGGAGDVRRGGGGAIVTAVGAGGATDFLQLADRFGADGRYEHATHCLLLGAIDHLARGGDRAWSDAMTSRELLGRLDVDDGRRGSFRTLVQAVERSLFGGRPVDRSMYEACRGELRKLLGDAA